MLKFHFNSFITKIQQPVFFVNNTSCFFLKYLYVFCTAFFCGTFGFCNTYSALVFFTFVYTLLMFIFNSYVILSFVKEIGILLYFNKDMYFFRLFSFLSNLQSYVYLSFVFLINFLLHFCLLHFFLLLLT